MRNSRLGKKSHGEAAPARAAALDALLEVENRSDTGSGEALEHAIEAHQLSPRDARLATAIVYGVLRRALWLDHQYARYLKQEPAQLDTGIRSILRMAACQWFLMERVPPHAIASDSVELARHRLPKGQHLTGFVNAVVRRILGMEAPVEPDLADRIRRLAAIHSHPEWIVRLFEKKFGAEVAEKALRLGNSEAPVSLRVNRLVAGSPEEIAKALDLEGTATLPGEISPDALLLRDSGRLREIISSPLFEAGAFYLQDEASQAVALLAAPRPGEKVLDLCAAPGGKATHMAELAGGRAQVIATDLSEFRLRLVRENAQRLRTPGLEVVPMGSIDEALAREENKPAYDLILVDAPCSGLGTLRRNPEIRYRSSRETIRRLAGEQSRILDSAARLVRPGGRIVYSTCTVTDDENREVVDGFLQSHPSFQLAESDSDVEAIRGLRGSDGIYRTWPAHFSADGFEAAVLKRTS